MAEFLLRVLLPTGLVGGLFYLGCLALRPLARRMKAAFHRALMAIVVALFLLPLPLLATLPAQDTAAEAPAPAVGQVLRQAAPTAGIYQAGHQLALALENEVPDGDGDTGAGSSPPDVAGLLTALYLTGLVAGAGFGLARYYWLMRGLAASCRPVAAQPVAALYAGLCEQLEVRNPPVLYTSDAVPAPLLAGVLRPRIILPAAGSDDARLEHALRHELTHHRRRDLLLKQLALAAGWVHWYNPLAHLLRRSLGTAIEQSCDEVVAAGYSPDQRRDYAGTLLHFAGRAPSPAVSAFASPKRQLRERMKRLMKPANPGRLLRICGVLLPALILCAALLAGCGLSAGAAAPDSSLPASDIIPDSTPSEAGSLPDEDLPPNDVSDTENIDPDVSVPDEEDDLDEPEDTPAEDEGADDAPLAATDFVCPAPDATHMSRLMTEIHRGVDFNGPLGTPIYAAAAGEVVTAEWHHSYGYYVVIEHSNGMRTLYAHCSELHVSAGQVVQQGQLIAAMGTTGNSSGPHCHLELTGPDGTLLNPMDYIPVPESIPLPSA